jgi:hypothetical protein
LVLLNPAEAGAPPVQFNRIRVIYMGVNRFFVFSANYEQIRKYEIMRSSKVVVS